MNPVSPMPAIVTLTIGLISIFFLVKRYGAPSKSGRYISIDGLRGYLAFFVFLCHSSVWYYYLRTNEWSNPPSRLYTHFGQSSVALFFMITGFLFCSKLINGRSGSIDWLRLYVSRFLRLVPLYVFSIILLSMIVAILSRFSIREPFHALMKHFITWLSVGILGSPDLNGLDNTSIIIARVTWTLRYEWSFYFILPILAVFIRSKTPLFYILISVSILVIQYIYSYFDITLLSAFAGGIGAAFLIRWDYFRSCVVGNRGAIVAVLSLVAAVSLFESANIPAIYLLAVAFSIIACGNTLFGALSNPLSRMLGEMAYSIYLLHGILLFFVFKFIVGFKRAASLTPLEHWLVILCCSAILIPGCFVTFRCIEAPSMRMVPNVTTWIGSLLSRRSESELSVRS